MLSEQVKTRGSLKQGDKKRLTAGAANAEEVWDDAQVRDQHAHRLRRKRLQPPRQL